METCRYPYTVSSPSLPNYMSIQIIESSHRSKSLRSFSLRYLHHIAPKLVLSTNLVAPIGTSSSGCSLDIYDRIHHTIHTISSSMTSDLQLSLSRFHVAFLQGCVCVHMCVYQARIFDIQQVRQSTRLDSTGIHEVVLLLYRSQAELCLLSMSDEGVQQ